MVLSFFDMVLSCLFFNLLP